MHNLRLALPAVGLVLAQAIIAGTTLDLRAQGTLGDLRDEVREFSALPAPPPRRPPPSCEPDESSFLGELIGELISTIVFGSDQPTHAERAQDSDDSPGLFWMTLAAPVTRPQLLAADDGSPGFFPAYPYAGDLAGFQMIEPWVLSGEIDWGRLGSAHLFHGRVTVGVLFQSVGVLFQSVEIYGGYDIYDVGRVQIDGVIGGLRVWF